MYAHLVGYLLKRLLPGTYHFEADINPAVEMTLLQQTEGHRLLVGLLNMQERVPTIPVGGTVRVRVPADNIARRVLHLPDHKGILFDGGYYDLVAS